MRLGRRVHHVCLFLSGMPASCGLHAVTSSKNRRRTLWACMHPRLPCPSAACKQADKTFITITRALGDVFPGTWKEGGGEIVLPSGAGACPRSSQRSSACQWSMGHPRHRIYNAVGRAAAHGRSFTAMHCPAASHANWPCQLPSHWRCSMQSPSGTRAAASSTLCEQRLCALGLASSAA